MRTNEERVSDAHQTLSQFSTLVDGTSAEFQIDPESVLTDLLANLMHYCHEAGLEFSKSVRIASDHYTAELAEENDR